MEKWWEQRLPLKVRADGGTFFTLSDRAILAEGGEWVVFRPIDDTVVKLYHDKRTLKQPHMTERLHALTKIQHNYALLPHGLVTYQGVPVGHASPFFDRATPLVSLFSNQAFRRHRLDNKRVEHIVRQMHDATHETHQNQAFIADPNEYNWLVRLGDDTLRLIDVDGWVLHRFPITPSVMPTVRDYTTPLISEASDWFGVAVVGFQFWSGVHPYRGRVDGYGVRDLERRMHDRVSVFAPGVTVPRSARGVHHIPKALRDWYYAVFQDGYRGAPPEQFGNASTATAPKVRTAVHKGASVSVERVAIPQDIKWVDGLWYEHAGTLKQVGNKKQYDLLPSGKWHIVRVGSNLVAHNRDTGVFYLVKQQYTSPIEVVQATDKVWRAHRQLFARKGGVLFHARMVMQRKLLFHSIGTTHQNAQRYADGGALAFYGLGRTFATVPSHNGTAKTIVLPHDVRRINALEVVGTQLLLQHAGAPGWQVYTTETEGRCIQQFTHADTDVPCTLVGEVLTCIPEGGALFLLHQRSGKKKTISHKGVHTGMHLLSHQGKLYARDGNEVFRIRVRA